MWKIKIIVDADSSGSTSITCGIDLGILLPGTNYLIIKGTGNTATITVYHGDDEVNLLRSIALPYVEQLVPSTSIFDLVQISNNLPKCSYMPIKRAV